ncbi:MAG: hypothetical protein GX492_11095 [Firmicutes bacterium]|nr:hypothetical protein [Bacillota bacterium]
MIGFGDGAQEAGVERRRYFGPNSPAPLLRAEFGSREGDLLVIEFAELAEFAEPIGRTSIAVPLHDRLKGPHCRGDRLRCQRP